MLKGCLNECCLFDNHRVKLAKNGKILSPDNSQRIWSYH